MIDVTEPYGGWKPEHTGALNIVLDEYMGGFEHFFIQVRKNRSWKVSVYVSFLWSEKCARRGTEWLIDSVK